MSKKGAGTRNSPIAIDDSEEEVLNELCTSSMHSTPPNHSPTAEGSLSQHQHTSTLFDRLNEDPRTMVTKKRKRAGSNVTASEPPVAGPSRLLPYQQIPAPSLENRLSGGRESKKAKRKRRRKNERQTQEALYKARMGQQGDWDGQFMPELPRSAQWPPPLDMGYQDPHSFPPSSQFGGHIDPRTRLPVNAAFPLDYVEDPYRMPYYNMSAPEPPPQPSAPSSSTWVSSMVMAASENPSNTDMHEHAPNMSWPPPQPSLPPSLLPSTPIDEGRPMNGHNVPMPQEFHTLPPKPPPRVAPQAPPPAAPKTSPPIAPKAAPPTAPKAAPLSTPKTAQTMSNQIIGMMPDPDPKSRHGVFTFPAKGQGANESSNKPAYIPNPARTLVMEQLPKTYRNADFVHSWSKSACGAQPVHVSVDSSQGKALVEFATAELARKAWGSPKLGKQNVGLKPHQLKGKPREDQIKVWWYRVVGVGAGAGVGEIEEGEIEGEEGGGEVRAVDRKETKKERKARLAREREEKKARKEREKAQKGEQLRKMGLLQDIEQQAQPSPSAPRSALVPVAHEPQAAAPMPSIPLLNGMGYHLPSPNTTNPLLSGFLPAMQAVNWNSLVAPPNMPSYPPPHRLQQHVPWHNHPQQSFSSMSSYGASLPQDVNGGYDDRESIASSRGGRSMSPEAAMPAPPPADDPEDYEDMEVEEDGDEQANDGDDMELDSPAHLAASAILLPLANEAGDAMEITLPSIKCPPTVQEPTLPSLPRPGEPPQISLREGSRNPMILPAARPANAIPATPSPAASSVAPTRTSTPRPLPSEPRAVRNAPTGPSHAKRSLLARQRELEERIAQSKRELELSLAAKAAASVRKSAPPSPPPLSPVQTPTEETDKQAMEDRLRKLVLQSQKAKARPAIVKIPSPPPIPDTAVLPPPTSASSAASSHQNSRTNSAVASSTTTPDLPAQALSPAAAHAFSLDDLAVSFITQTIQTVKSHPPPPPPKQLPFRPNTKLELAAKQKRLEQHIAESKILMAKLTQARTKQEKDVIMATLRDMSRVMEEEDRVAAANSELPSTTAYEPPRRNAWNPAGPAKMRWPDSQADAGVFIVSDDEDDEDGD